jgi:MarR family transcriptional regulator, organic hydroperoxide resistance regulator
MPERPTCRRSHGELSEDDSGGSRPPPSTAADESIGYLARHAYRAFVRALAAKLDPHGIATGEWSALRVLWQEEGLSQVDLAQRMRVERASLTGVLTNMQAKGLIDRQVDRGDRRKVKIGLTARGRAMRKALLPYGADINAAAISGMTAAEVAQLRRLLGRVIGNLEASAD